ncbi:MAG: ribonuclease R [Lentisphaeria bacterium]|nr:ribonuclease R [Lentisphaeria bacterium]
MTRDAFEAESFKKSKRDKKHVTFEEREGVSGRRRDRKPQREAVEASGVLSVNVQGFGFVRAEGNESFFVPPGKLGGGITGDTVLVVVDPQSDPERPVAHVKRILERRYSRVVGCLVPLKGHHWGIRPLRHELPDLLMVTDESVRACGIEPREGNWCQASLAIPEGDFPPDRLPFAELTGSLGACGDVTGDLDAIVAEYDIPAPYTAEDEAYAEALKPIQVRRMDCTKDTVVTIDPVDARDYDDALSISPSGKNGQVVVGVHIADVGCYVRPGARLDEEARKRVFTSYLPGRTLPMLPKALANVQCSLQAGVPRLAHSVFIRIDEHTGEIISWERRHTTINVRQRLCYEQVQTFLDGGTFEAEEGVLELVKKLANVARLLRHRRMTKERFLPMAMPEIRVVCSEKPSRIMGIQENVENPSHQLVEEFMLAANECIANELQRMHLAGLYRNHQCPDPEKLQEFAETATIMLGKTVKNLTTRGAIVRFLRQAAESPLKDVLYMSFLRHLPRADYGPECMGHYGLGKEHYCHFTSPIRRYSDLLVHQQLLAADLRRRTFSEERVAEIGMLCCQKEYNCDQAEFAASDRMKIRYIIQQLREKGDFTLTGEICKITKAGCQVYMPEYGLIGYVNEPQLGRGWKFDHLKIVWRNIKTGDQIYITQTRQFRVDTADPVRGEIELIPDMTARNKTSKKK